MKKLNILMMTSIFLVSIILTGCGKKELKDGTFTGVVTKEEANTKNAGDSTVVLTIKDGKIVDCKYESRDSKGNVKDENYGKEAGEQNYKKAQKAVVGIRKYPEDLVKTQDIDKVDSVSGATVSYKIFVDATKKALEEASK